MYTRAIELSSADDRNQSRGTSQIFMCLFETVIKVYSTCATCIICKQWKTKKSALRFVLIHVRMNEMRIVFILRIDSHMGYMTSQNDRRKIPFFCKVDLKQKKLFSTITRINRISYFILFSPMLCYFLSCSPCVNNYLLQTNMTEQEQVVLPMSDVGFDVYKTGMMIGINSKNCDVKI